MEAAQGPGEQTVEFEAAGYWIELRVRRTEHRLTIVVRRLLSIRKYRPSLRTHRSLQSPILDVWRGVSRGVIELARTYPRVYVITIKGRPMTNPKLVSLLRRRLGFEGADSGFSTMVFLWRRPDERAGLRHRIEFGLRGVSEILRRWW